MKRSPMLSVSARWHTVPIDTAALSRPLLIGMEWFDDVPGGLNRYLRDLHVALRDGGTDVTSIVAGPATHPPAGVHAASMWSAPLVVRLSALLWTARRLRRYCDVVDAHFPLHALLPVLLPLRGKPMVAHFHGPWAEESRSDGESRNLVLAVKGAIERRVYGRAERTVVLSESFGRLLVSRYGVAPWRVQIVRPGVDLVRFRPTDVPAARAALGLPREAFIALAVRRLVPRMGLGVLLGAWAGLDAGNRATTLLIAGDGPERDALAEQAADLGIADSVRFLGRVSDDELVRYYQSADVCVVPSVELEGFGLVVLEALACGTPVIVTDIGGLPEVVADLQPDLVVAPGRADVLATRLSTAATGARPLPSRAACRSFADGYSLGRLADRHRQVYASAATGKRRRPQPQRLSAVYIDHCAQLSGGELALLRLLPALRDVDAHVILAEDGPLVEHLQDRGVSVEVLPMRPDVRTLRRDRVGPSTLATGVAAAGAGYVLRLWRRLCELRPDLVHTNSLKSAVYGGLAARIARVPLVWHIRDRIADDYLPARAAALIQQAARWVPDVVIANSSATRATLGAAAAGTFVVPSPVDTSPRERVPHEALTVGLVGRLAPWKGQDIFVRAFAQAFPNGPERAVVVGQALFGEHDYERRVQELAADLGIADRVDFRGFRQDVPGELAAMDVLVHASTVPEPFGQVVVEGMAAGLPVVAAGAGGPAEVIRDGVHGLLYPPGDVDGLAGALCRLASDERLRDRLGAAGRARSQQFAPELVAAEVIRIYRQVVRRC